MDILELWPSLHKSALLGTARGGEIVPHDAPETLRAVAADREGALLSMLALATSQRRAGIVIPQPDTASAASTCADDSWPTAPAAACVRLRGLSDGSDLNALREWLGLASERQVLAPHNALPNLLRVGVRHKNLRAEIVPVLGERGRWLASQLPAWKWAAGFGGTSADEAEAIFRDGEDAGRAEAFALLRSLDANRAVQVLAELWKSESAGKREAWVQALAPELNAGDEDFLEAALDDRTDAVRKMAAQTLAALPDSNFARRAFKRARKYLSADFHGGELRLQISLPSEWDADWKRDGIDENVRAANGTSGQRTYWLVQMIGFVVPARWEELWQATPEHILAAALRDEKTLVQGLSLAAIRALDKRWMSAILSTPEAMQAASSGTPYTYLLRRVDAPVREAVLVRRVREVMKNAALNDHTSVVLLLENHPEPWDAELTRVMLSWLDSLVQGVADRIAAAPKTPPHALPGLYAFQMMPKFAALMHLETLLATPLDWPDDLPPAVQKAHREIREVADARREMHREFDF